MNKLMSSLVFFLIVVGGGISIGVLTAPGDWYAQLQKPFFNPANWIFGPVWTVLYLIIAYVGWRIWYIDERTALWQLWLIQMALNFLWSPVFFAAQKPALALIVIAGLLMTLVLLIRAARRNDPVIALLFLPYLAWVSFATLLNAAIVSLN